MHEIHFIFGLTDTTTSCPSSTPPLPIFLRYLCTLPAHRHNLRGKIILLVLTSIKLVSRENQVRCLPFDIAARGKAAGLRTDPIRKTTTGQHTSIQFAIDHLLYVPAHLSSPFSSTKSRSCSDNSPALCLTVEPLD